MTAALTPQQKKNYLLNKYVKRDYKIEDIELCKKYAVYFNPSIEKVKEWTFVCATDTLEQAKFEILFRKKHEETGDGDLVVDNDPRFSSWRNELKNINPETNQPYEPGQELMKLDYNSSGNMLQVIANSTPEQQSKNGFRGTGYYLQNSMTIDYKGFYKIVEIYEI